MSQQSIQVQKKVQDISTRLMALGSKDTSSNVNRPLHLANITNNHDTIIKILRNFPFHSFKMDVPEFDESDPLSWIFKINRFFNFHNTPDKQIITIASFYTDGTTLNWY